MAFAEIVLSDTCPALGFHAALGAKRLELLHELEIVENSIGHHR